MTAATEMTMRRFQLIRDVDETGTSGTGIVAEGLEFTDGSIGITWLTPFKYTPFCPNIKCIWAVHGHHGKTRVVWIDSIESVTRSPMADSHLRAIPLARRLRTVLGVWARGVSQR